MALLPALGDEPAAAASAAAAVRPEAAGAYRLGTAATPYGWSTAVADFNADGAPDVVVADRAAGRRGLAYRLEFSISGRRPSTETFESAADGVSIHVADIDHDSNADIVVAAAVSGQTIAVWLNDGAGHFTRATGHLAIPAAWTSRRANGVDRAGDLDGVDLPSPRPAGLPSSGMRAAAAAAGRAWRDQTDRFAPALVVLSSAGPRAPPTAVPSLAG